MCSLRHLVQSQEQVFLRLTGDRGTLIEFGLFEESSMIRLCRSGPRVLVIPRASDHDHTLRVIGMFSCKAYQLPYLRPRGGRKSGIGGGAEEGKTHLEVVGHDGRRNQQPPIY